MLKKLIAGLLVSAMALFALPNNELELVLIAKTVEKKVIVLSNMNLKDKTKEDFGKVYDAYQVEVMKLGVKKLQLIEEFASKYNDMTDKNADKILADWLSIDKASYELQATYMKKFSKVMPSSDVIRYFQIENRFQLENELKAASILPLSIPKVLAKPEMKKTK